MKFCALKVSEIPNGHNLHCLNWCQRLLWICWI